MAVITADGWQDFELIDTGDGERLERWGSVRLIRPDPQILWPRSGDGRLWQEASLRYHRSRSGGGHWEKLSTTAPDRWTVSWNGLCFHIRPTDFKHMGLFPEQAANWQWMMQLIGDATSPERPVRPVRILNLFAYTGGATVAALAAGADVTHVDAAKGMNQWAKDNIALSGLNNVKHRVITDDVMKFVKREARRQSYYDAVIMDPPAFGRGPSGELWKLEDRLYELVEHCIGLLSDKPLFFLINAYTAGFSPVVAENILKVAFSRHTLAGSVTVGEVGLPITCGGLTLPCGLFGRWVAH